MTERSQVVAVTVHGAAVGALAGYMMLTPRGRSLRRQLEPALRGLGRELNEVGTTIVETAGVASGGWRLLLDLISDSRSRFAHHSTTQQSRPF